MSFKKSIKSRVVIYLTITSAVVLIGLLCWIYFRSKENTFNKNELWASSFNQQITEKINRDWAAQYNIVTTVSKTLRVPDQITPDSLKNITNPVLKSNLSEYQNFNSFKVIWEPDTPDSVVASNAERLEHGYIRNNEVLQYEENYLDNSVNAVISLYHRIKNSREKRSYLRMNEGVHTVYFGCPITNDNRFVGAVFFNLDLKHLTNIFDTQKLPLKESSIGIIEGSGKIIRHSDPGKTGLNIRNLYHFTKDELSRLNDKIALEQAFSMESSRGDDNREAVTAFFTPLLLTGTNNSLWIQMVIPNKEVYGTVQAIGQQALIGGIAGLLLVALVVFLIFHNNISRPLRSTTRLLQALSSGDIHHANKVSHIKNDEIGQVNRYANRLLEGLDSMAKFAEEIGKGNLQVELEKLSEEDVLGESLIKMRESLNKARQDEEKRKEEDARKDWVNQGIAKLSDILRDSSDNMEDFSYNIISNLVKYIEANQGGLFVIEEDENNKQYVELKACYAFDRRKHLQKTMGINEGLVGRCILEKETIYMSELPDEYINITSGLGEGNPKSLLLVPLLLNDEVYGVIELASFDEFKPHVRSFVERIGQSIATTISRVKVNIRTSRLLEESRNKAEELSSQEEELRQNMEELQSTQEELAKEKNLMDALMNNLPDNIYFKDREGKFMLVSANHAKHMGYDNPDDLKGLSDFDLFTEEHAMPAYEDEQRIMETGEPIIGQEEKETFENGEETWVSTTKMPLKDQDGNTIGTFGISRDITKLKQEQSKKEQVIQELEEERNKLQEKQKQYEEEKILMDALMANMPDDIYFKDEESRFIKVSQHLLIKHPQADTMEDILGKSDFDFFSEEHARQAYEDEQEIIRTGEPLINKEEKETFEDGSVKWALSSKMPLKDSEGNVIGTFGISRDITSMKEKQFEAEAISKESINKENILHGFSENLPVLVYRVDADKKITECRGEGMKLIGLTKKQAIGKALSKVFPEAMNKLPEESLGKDETVGFRTSTKYKNKSYTLEHRIFDDRAREDQFIGYAYQINLV